jgi:hypothetical protein
VTTRSPAQCRGKYFFAIGYTNGYTFDELGKLHPSVYMVAPTGVDPVTSRFSVVRSTN